MDEQNKEELLDELLKKAVDSGRPAFDAERWKQKFPEACAFFTWRDGNTIAQRQPNPSQMLPRSRIIRLAAAAVIVVAVGVAVFHRRPAEQVEPARAVKTTQSPAKMMSRLSLTLAYRQGGMEAIDQRCREASKLLGGKGRSVSIQELLNGDNGGS